MKIKSIILSIVLSLNLYGVTVGETPNEVLIGNENGGLVSDNSQWSSSSLRDKVFVLFYVDPDEKDTNNAFSKALKAKKYDRTNYGSIAIINMAATWKPNFAIASALESKQEEFPDTLYIKDLKSVLVNEWALEDDASNILIFSKNGKLLFYKSGALNEEDIKTALSIIEDNI